MNTKNTINININDMNRNTIHIMTSNNTVESIEEISFEEIDDIRKPCSTIERIEQKRYVQVTRGEMLRAYNHTVLEPVPYCYKILVESAYDTFGQLRWIRKSLITTAERKFRIQCV